MIVREAALRLNTKNFDVQKHLSNRKKTLQQLTTFLAHFKHISSTMIGNRRGKEL
jgi:hypothetical protein